MGYIYLVQILSHLRVLHITLIYGTPLKPRPSDDLLSGLVGRHSSPRLCMYWLKASLPLLYIVTCSYHTTLVLFLVAFCNFCEEGNSIVATYPFIAKQWVRLNS